MNRSRILHVVLFLAFFTARALALFERPNIVLIYSDDLDYGDVSCYGATKIQTPNIDRLAKEGLRFTDAHSSAAGCMPLHEVSASPPRTFPARRGSN